ncbi:putative ribonuclease H-like domain-containing protein, partial [Tanacetum coccineum]
AYYDDEGAMADFTNLETIVNVSPIPTSRIHFIHPSTQILGDPKSAVLTRSKLNKSSGAYAFVSHIQKQRRNNHKDFQHCLFDCFLSQNEPKKISEALKDESWVDSMQEELLQFKIQKGHRQEEGIDNDEVFSPVARIEAIRIFLAFASYMGFIVYQMDVKSAFLYGTIDEEVYVSQPLGFVDPKCPQKVYKVVKALYGLHQAPRAWYDKTFFIKKDKNDIMLVQVYVDDNFFGSTKRSWCDELEALTKSRFQMSSMGELTFFLGLQVKQKEDGIFKSQDKYVVEILKKFDFASVKTASTPIETQKPLVKDKEATDVDVHLYRSMIGTLMYLTASRPNIMFAVCACSRYQVTSKTSHLNAVKRIFRYLKGKPKLGLWYPRVSSFDLDAYSNSDYAGANLDRKSTTRGCQFLGRRLISWQSKKQTIMATSTTEAKYVDDANCCGQVLWIQNQMLDYGFNFMNTKIYIDNESTICIVKNPTFHSKTKHVEIRHHFIRDAYKKKLIQVALVKERQVDLLYSLYEVFYEQKNLDDDDVFHRYIKFNTARVAFVLLIDVSWLVLLLGLEVRCLEKSKEITAFSSTSGSSSLHALHQLCSPLKGVKFSGKVTPSLIAMLVQNQDPLMGEGSEQPTEPQPIPSPTHPSAGDQPSVIDTSSSHDTTQDSRDSLEEINRSEGTQGFLLLETSRMLSCRDFKFEDQIKKLKRKRCDVRKRIGVCIQTGRKNATYLNRNIGCFNDLIADGRDYMETEDVVKEGAKDARGNRQTVYIVDIASRAKLHQEKKGVYNEERGKLWKLGGYKHSQLKAKTFAEIQDGTEIHMLAERKYPLTKETLERMLSLRLVAGILK